MSQPNAALRALLHAVVDYAGLFPPAGLGMAEAVTNYGRYRRGPHAWMLARFIVPAGRLDEFLAAAEGHLPPAGGEGDPWPLSVLVQDPAGIERAQAFGQAQAGVRVEGFEARPADHRALRELAAATGEGEEIFFELDWRQDPQPWLDAVADADACAKLRSGGVTPELYPGVAEFARFLSRCKESGVALKFTAGLHHPLRGDHALTYEPGAPVGTMYGFLNAFAAAALLDQGHLRRGELAELLQEATPGAIDLGDGGLRWREHHLTVAELQRSRRFARSFGSCSFTEPVEDLQTLEML